MNSVSDASWNCLAAISTANWRAERFKYLPQEYNTNSLTRNQKQAAQCMFQRASHIKETDFVWSKQMYMYT